MREKTYMNYKKKESRTMGDSNQQILMQYRVILPTPYH